MRAIAIASLLLGGCSDDYVIKLDTYQRAIARPGPSRFALRAKKFRNDEDAWIRLDSIRNVKISPATVEGNAPHRRLSAAAFFVLSALGAGVVAGGAAVLAPVAGKSCSSDCTVETVALVFGSLSVIVGVVAMAGGTVAGALQLTKPDSEVKAGRADLVYVE